MARIRTIFLRKQFNSAYRASRGESGEQAPSVRCAVIDTTRKVATGTARLLGFKIIGIWWGASICTGSPAAIHRFSPHRKISRIYGQARHPNDGAVVVIARIRFMGGEAPPCRSTTLDLGVNRRNRPGRVSGCPYLRHFVRSSAP
jgi:hypothetical protein